MGGEPASTNEADLNDFAWWYQRGNETIGPVTSSELQALIKSNDLTTRSMVWREDFGDQWKPLNQTDFQLTRPTIPGPPPLPISSKADPKKWQETFEKFDRDQSGFYYSRNIWGFLFGPFYYFYLRMWRKGFVIIGLSMCISLTVSLLSAMLNLPPLQRYVGLGINAFCGMFAARDFYRMNRFGERMWPSLSWFENPWAIVALNIIPVLIASALVSYAADANSSDASTGSFAAASDGAKVGQDVQKAAVRNPTTVNLTDGNSMQAQKIAVQNCAQWLEQNYGDTTANKYDGKTIYTYRVELQGGDISTNALYFGGHRTMYFIAHLAKYVDGVLNDRSDLPGHVCVLSDDLQVIGVEDSFDDGLK